MNIKWNADNYKNSFSFVPSYGEDLINLLTVKENSFVVDLGCGNGTLTKKLYDKGYNVIGIDASKDMLKLAKEEYKNINFINADALEFKLEEKADAIFSNVVFHWIDKENQEKLISNIASNLKLNGELVCEFGGYGCAEAVHRALENSFNKRGIKYPRVFYFPTIGEYSPMLEKYGLKVEYAILFDRPTKQNGDVVDWINMFVTKPFENIDDSLRKEIQNEVRENLKDTLYIDNNWYIDYVRIRIRARKNSV